MGSLIIFSQNGTELLLYAVLFLGGFVGDCKRFFPFYVPSFLKRKYERKQFGICWFAKQAKQASPRGAKVSRNPLKSFLIVRGFGACGDGGKQGLFIFSNRANNVGRGICKRENQKGAETASFMRI